MRRILLATTAITFFASTTVYAQDTVESTTEQPAEEENAIVVTGIRGGLQNAQNIKQNSDFTVDAISAEDVGKFPTANVAEALQQVPGIAISKSGGEGQQITVRGLGPDFNLVLLNGRRVATDSDGRGFNFDTIASDLLGGTEIYKTTNVSLQDGGIGSTVNLKTQRPLSMRSDSSAVVSARALYDDQSGKVTPQIFGLVSKTFADGRIGVLLSGAYQKRKSVKEVASAASWLDKDLDAAEVATLFQNGTGNGAGTYWFPEKYTYNYYTDDRERTSLSGTVQAELSDDITLTVDALYTKFTTLAESSESAQFGNRSNIVPGSVVADSNNAVTRYSFINGPEFVKITENRPTKTWAFGGNLAWNVTSNLKTELDISQSTATRSGAGLDSYYVIHGPDTVLTYDNTGGYAIPVGYDGAIRGYDPLIFPSGSPQLAAAQPVGSTWSRNNPNGYRSWWTTNQGNSSKDKIFEVRLDNTYTFDAGVLDKIRFGFSYGKQDKDLTVRNSNDVGWGNYGANGIPLPGALFYADNHPGMLSKANAPVSGQFLNFNGQALINYLLSPEALALRDQIHGFAPGTSAAAILPRGYSTVVDPANTYGVQEKVLAAYSEVTLKTDLGTMPFVMNIGGRFTHTKQTAQSTQRDLLDILRAPGSGGTQYVAVLSSTFNPVSKENTYSNFLPSANLKLNLRDDLVFRAAVSKSLTRPTLSYLNPAIAFPSTLRPENLQASGGGGDLKPFTAWNYDASLEWYYSRTGYLSVAYFRKDVGGFIVSSVVPYQITIPNRDGITNAEDKDINGNVATFDLARGVNLGSARITGWEIAFQHSFDYLPSFLQHMGVTASVTLPSTNREFDTASRTNNGSIPGLSDSYFLTGYYDDGNFELRLTYSHRDKYFERNVTSEEPGYVLASDVLDARISYDITDNIQIFADAFNFTNEPIRREGRYASQFLSFEQNGARYDAGVRIKF